MIEKRVICPERLRRIPRQFSWVDHRLIRNNYIGNCGTEALALYLFLVTVSDAKGLSYYSDASICKLFSLNEETLVTARSQLMRAELIAYKSPIYQVLSLDIPQIYERQNRQSTSRSNKPMSIGEILSGIKGEEK